MVTEQMFLAGEWAGSLTAETYNATNPATGETIATVPQGDREDAVRAIAAARQAAGTWGRLTAFERAAKMHAVGDIIESRRDELARTLTLDQGKPLRAEAYDEVDELVEYWRMAAEDAKRLGGELPNSFSARQAGAADPPPARGGRRDQPVELAVHDAGRADRPGAGLRQRRGVDARPDDRRVRGRAGALHRRCRPAARHVQPGDRPGPGGRRRDRAQPGVDGVGFIGSTGTGRLVAAAAAGKATLLEMGGNGPVVVLADGDVDAAVAATLTACFLCAGQSCTAGERILVARPVYDEFVEKLARAVTEQIVLGDPFDDATTMGPLNNEPVAAKMDEHVADARERGADVLSGGSRAPAFPTDLYWEPTVLTGVPADARVATEETFGPVAPVVAIDSLEHAIELTNQSPYGLLAAIFTASLSDGLRFADEVRTGWVNINESSNYWEAHLPFGGRSGSDSGIGRVGGAHVMQSFTELQTITITPDARPR